MDTHSLHLLEFDRVTAAVAGLATCDAGRDRLLAWRPLADRARLAEECARLAEAIRRQGEPGEWCDVGPGDPAARLSGANEEPLDGVSLVEIREWLEAAHRTQARWTEADLRTRFPRLLERIATLPRFDALRQQLTRALEPDGRVSDAASPALARARAAVVEGERALEQQLTRWARAHGETAYVTRHGERFVALVPAAGFARRQGVVHDVSGSGQSLFVEPLDACEANNRLLEHRSTAHEEERRVLRELATAVLDRGGEINELIETLVQLDGLRARARWGRSLGASALLPTGERLRLVRARHPLLAMARPDDVVPLELTLEPGARLLLVSGPNMGGKTVLLKTVGLAVLLAHSALPVPADESSEIPEIDRVVVDLGDEQSVEQGLSTFAAHLRRLGEMAEAAGPRTLLLADELGAGTDPEEGAALARALIERFAAERALGVVTTHLGSLKRAAGQITGIAHGSMEFDPETLTPRYRYIGGIPGASLALAVAERLGLPADILARARALTPEESLAMARLLSELQEVRRALEVERESLAAARAGAELAEAEHRRATEHGRITLEELRRRLTQESESLLARSRELWQTIQREARRSERSRAGAESLRDGIASSERAIEALQRRVESELPPIPAAAVEALAPGAKVHVRDLGIEAEVAAAPDEEGRVTLQRGSWTIHSHVSKLSLAGAGAGAAGVAPRPVARFEPADEAPALELDLRGMEVEEALRALDVGLDRAVVSGLGELRIVHGIGKGVLRAAVERHLRGHPQVALARLGEGHEGGRGATVAKLR